MPTLPRDEVFPGRLQRFVGAIDADHQNRGQRRELDCHPHHPDVVGEQREIHREHKQLIHGMIETQERCRKSAGLELVGDVASAEYARSKPHKRREHDEHVVEIIDVEIRSGVRPTEEQGEGDDESDKRRQDVDARGDAIVRQHRKQSRRTRRYEKNNGDGIEGHSRSPR
jgi:hypothetical protein